MQCTSTISYNDTTAFCTFESIPHHPYCCNCYRSSAATTTVQDSQRMRHACKMRVKKTEPQTRLLPLFCCCCCSFTPPLPWDGGMARTAIQVHAINLIELGQGKSGSQFRTSRKCKLQTGSPTTNKADCHWWAPKSRLLRHAHWIYSSNRVSEALERSKSSSNDKWAEKQLIMKKL